jgi:hypothetical protein
MKRIFLLFSLLAIFAANSFGQVCAAPATVVAIPRTDGALVLWTTTGATLYEVQYRIAIDSAVWISATVQSSGNVPDSASLQISRLLSCQAYAVRVRAKCSATLFSDWRTSTFKTVGCPVPCAAPRGLFAAARDSSASLNWASGGTGVTYVVQIKKATDTIYRTVNATTNSLAAEHLQLCTAYQFRVKTVCSATASSDYSEVASFKTLGCTAPCATPREVRAVTEGTNKINFLWIGTSTLGYEVQYRIGDSAWSASTRVTTLTYKLENTQSCKAYSFRVRTVCAQTGGVLLYSEWSGTAKVISAGCAVVARCETPRRLSYVPTTAGTSSLLRWDTIAGVPSQTYDVQWMGARDSGVWRTVAAVRGNQYNLTGLATCQVYMFRVKANCSATSTSNWSEPVRFLTLGCAPLCSKPKNLKTFVNDTSVVFSWDRADLTNYTLTVASSDGSFSTRTIPVTGFSYTLSGLVRCKTYKAVLVTTCANAISEAATVAFTTVTRTCVTNNTCKVESITTGTANDSTVVEANATILASAFEMQYRKATDSAWSATVSAARPRFVLRGLTRCLNYVVRVRAVCTTGAGEWLVKDFRAGNGCFANPNGGDVAYLLGQSGAVTSFNVYPNPGRDALALSYKLEQDAAINIQLVNLQGKIMTQLDGGLQEAGYYNQTLDNLGGLNEGLYMLVVRANGKVLATQKWTKQ